jgi:HK97 family phage portal protein
MSQRPAAQAASPLARFGAGIARLWPVGRRAREAKASKAGPLIALETPRGEPVWTPRDYASFAREGVMSNAIVYRSVRMIAEAAASVPLLLYEGRAEIEEHPLLDLLQRPSPGQTGTDLLESFYGFLLVAGNAYLEAARVGGELRELHVLRPDRMKVVPGADGWPEAFEYTAGGASVRIAAEPVEGVRPVLHMKLFHPANDHYGLSPIEAAATAIDLHNAAARWNKALLDNSARPSGALVYTSGAQMTGEQFERLKAELEASFQGARNAGRPLLLEGGLDWKTMSLSPRDLDFMEARHAAAREIALAIGVPPMLLGIPGDNTYANYAEANRAFWRQTVLPLVNRMARALGGWLGPAWGGELRLAPDLDQIEALTPEREALWARIGAADFLSDDEKRAAVGYGNAEEGGERASSPFARKYREDQARDDRGRWVDEGRGEDEEGYAEEGAEGGDDSETELEPTAGRGRSPGPPPKAPSKQPQPDAVPIPPGTTIRNKDLAGKKHPDTGVPFDSQGFADFSGVATRTVTIPGGHRGTNWDFGAANHAANLPSTPPGMTWHHHQDGRTMQLVPRDVHSRTGHTGSRGIGNLPGKR